MLKKSTVLALILGFAACAVACSRSAAVDNNSDKAASDGPAHFSANMTYSTIVDQEGNISLPRDVAEKWFHLGSFAVVNDGTDEGNGMHHVYTTADVVEHYNRTGEFADGSVLLKDVTGMNRAALTTGRSHWQTETKVWFIMVKDTKGRFEDNPLWGDGWGWALYNGDDLNTQVAKDYKQDCIGCHVPVEDNDWVHTFAYPSINDGDFEFIEAKASSGATDPKLAQSEMAIKAGGDAIAGEGVFKRCASCHSKEPGKNGLGPSLANVIGRKAGSLAGYNYSSAMKSSDVVWTAETLESHLTDVKGFIPGNRMGNLFPVGVPNAQERADVIAYLQTLSTE